ncbi:rhodanese-like domain-containing protein [Myxococcota bacterium]|nr:rhodanese-like domain-containing protein [Myxococcota bacterium]
MSKLIEAGTQNPAGYRDVTPAQVASLRGTELLVDVREVHEYRGELGHIQGAELVPLATVAEAASRWDKDRELVVVCRSGGRSGRAAAMLAANGFTRVANMVGGMLAWNDAKLPVETK